MFFHVCFQKCWLWFCKQTLVESNMKKLIKKFFHVCFSMFFHVIFWCNRVFKLIIIIPHYHTRVVDGSAFARRRKMGCISFQKNDSFTSIGKNKKSLLSKIASKGASRNRVVLFLGFFDPPPPAWFYSYK